MGTQIILFGLLFFLYASIDEGMQTNCTVQLKSKRLFAINQTFVLWLQRYRVQVDFLKNFQLFFTGMSFSNEFLKNTSFRPKDLQKIFKTWLL